MLANLEAKWSWLSTASSQKIEALNAKIDSLTAVFAKPTIKVAATKSYCPLKGKAIKAGTIDVNRTS